MSQTHPLTTTTFDLPGYRTTKSHGVVRGIVVRSRSVIGNIGAGIQSQDFFADIIARGQHQHRHPAAALAQRATDGQAIAFRQHPVENDQVVSDLAQLFERLTARATDIGDIALFG